MIRQKGKRLFYVPGMISLVLLPLLCLWHFYSHGDLIEYGCISIGYPDEEFMQEAKSKYGFPAVRNYKEFTFNAPEAIEINKFKSLRNTLIELKKNTDTINGVKIHFGQHSDYATYMHVLNDLKATGMPTYGQYEDDMWVVIPNKPKKIAEKEEYGTMNCGTQDIIDSENKRMLEYEEEKAKKEFQITFYKEKWLVLLGYLGIVILNIFALVKFIKNRKFKQKSYI